MNAKAETEKAEPLSDSTTCVNCADELRGHGHVGGPRLCRRQSFFAPTFDHPNARHGETIQELRIENERLRGEHFQPHTAAYWRQAAMKFETDLDAAKAELEMLSGVLSENVRIGESWEKAEARIVEAESELEAARKQIAELTQELAEAKRLEGL